MLQSASKFAHHAHRGQQRRHGGEYISHPLAVKSILEQCGVEDAEILAAALLHDTMEDCGVTWTTLHDKFGTNVANMVTELTDDGTLNREQRHAMQCVKIATLSLGSLYVKMADRIHNLSCFAQQSALERPDRLRTYAAFTENLIEAVDRRASQLLADEIFTRLYGELRKHHSLLSQYIAL